MEGVFIACTERQKKLSLFYSQTALKRKVFDEQEISMNPRHHSI